MKKQSFLRIIFSMLIIFAYFAIGSIFSAPAIAAEYGDLDDDGSITSFDLTRIIGYIIDDDIELEVSEEYADLDGSGSVDSLDVSILQQYILGQMDKFPVEEDLIAGEKAEELLAKLTLDEKAGQMIQAERSFADAEDVKNFKLGSILSGGGSSPGDNVEDWQEMTADYQNAALGSEPGIPIIYGTDAVHGHNNVEGAVIFPHNIGLGAANDPELMRDIGRVTAMEMIETGVNWNFAPCVAVARDIRWGRTYESYSEDPDIVSRLAIPYIEGLQEYNIAATAKHYLGDGAAEWGTGEGTNSIDQGDARISEEELREIHLPPYEEAVEAGVKSVMISFSSWNGVKCHEHDYLINDVLKDELGFEGFVISDYEGIQQIDAGDYYSQVVKAVNAGVDMLMEPRSWDEARDILVEAVESGDIEESRINDAVKRILKIKYQIDLFEDPQGKSDLVENELGADEHRDVAREAVRKSQVLLKNTNELLPLDESAEIYVTGSNADNLGNQCGGWTISWQGSRGDITKGTTIYEAIDSRAQITDDLNRADVGIAVVGETPYAEGEGDDGELGLSNDDLEDINEIIEAGKPVVVILVSGRPLMISDHIDSWDAFVAAWLPGTEGDGVADVLFGDYDFAGELPFTWPESIDQVPISNDDSEDPLFPAGAGLNYSAWY
ncbi:MAG: glycoside hydrolase family 3 N-terminal domain-containing protein [Halanaerobiales bacterium]